MCFFATGRYATVVKFTGKAPQASAPPLTVQRVGGRVFSVSVSIAGVSGVDWEVLVVCLGEGWVVTVPVLTFDGFG